jgi:hypothetical protein
MQVRAPSARVLNISLVGRERAVEYASHVWQLVVDMSIYLCGSTTNLGGYAIKTVDLSGNLLTSIAGARFSGSIE